jgi:hypothetical protein
VAASPPTEPRRRANSDPGTMPRGFREPASIPMRWAFPRLSAGTFTCRGGLRTAASRRSVGGARVRRPRNSPRPNSANGFFELGYRSLWTNSGARSARAHRPGLTAITYADCGSTSASSAHYLPFGKVRPAIGARPRDVINPFCCTLAIDDVGADLHRVIEMKTNRESALRRLGM